MKNKKRSKVKRSRGRPLKFKRAEDMQEKIDEYFAQCRKNSEPLTITGLALALNLTRQGLLDYQERDEFADTIKKAKLLVEKAYEVRLATYSGNVAGNIFALKQFGWTDRRDLAVQNTTAVKSCDLGPEMERLMAEVCGPQRATPPLRVRARAEPEPIRALPAPEKLVIDAEIVADQATDEKPKFRPLASDPEDERPNMMQYRETEERSRQRYEQHGYDVWKDLKDADGSESRLLPPLQRLYKS